MKKKNSNMIMCATKKSMCRFRRKCHKCASCVNFVEYVFVNLLIFDILNFCVEDENIIVGSSWMSWRWKSTKTTTTTTKYLKI